jgi:uncharacterized membrane protein YagU involved in acid resistance
MGRTIALATLVAGTLDIVFATILTLLYRREPAAMLRTVASGPFPAATDMGTSGAILGLIVHFTLMAIMATVFVLAARRLPALIERPIQWGILYGLAAFVVMNLVVVPLRFGNWPPKPMSIATQLFAHIVPVGIPIALITARNLRPRRI